MDKEKIKKLKVFYCPYKALRKIVSECLYYCKYIVSLSHIKKNQKRVERKIDNKEVLNVVFIIQYIPGWNKLEPIYRGLLDDDRFNPIIMCVPLNIQGHVLLNDNYNNDTYDYFTGQGYEVVNALNNEGEWIDLKNLKPDYVFHSRPYNSFMPKCYTSGEVVKYALICNVMYGAIMTMNEEDVVLNRNYFCNCYIYYAFDKWEVEFYKKRFFLGTNLKIQLCLPFGTTAIEQMIGSDCFSSKGGFKNVVLWTPRWSTDEYVGGSTFFKFLCVIKELIKINKDVLFIIRPHPLMFENFVKTGEMSREEVASFHDYCIKTDNVLLDEKKEYKEVFYKSDFIISDISGMLPEYFALKKPIMYCGRTDRLVQWFGDILKTCYIIEDADEMKQTFYNLINRQDDYKEERKAVFNKLFCNIENSSRNIIESLYNIK